MSAISGVSYGWGRTHTGPQKINTYSPPGTGGWGQLHKTNKANVYSGGPTKVDGWGNSHYNAKSLNPYNVSRSPGWGVEHKKYSVTGGQLDLYA